MFFIITIASLDWCMLELMLWGKGCALLWIILSRVGDCLNMLCAFLRVICV